MLLMVCLLAGCKGTITSREPLLSPANAAYPFPPAAEVEAWSLNDDNVWERREGTARLTLQDRAYRVTEPGESLPSPDSFLFRQIEDGLFIVQASNGTEWAYGLIVHADMYYLFTFNRTDQNCTSLSAAERSRFAMTVADDVCYVSSLKDLIGLLLHLRQRFPLPTSAFTPRWVDAPR